VTISDVRSFLSLVHIPIPFPTPMSVFAGAHDFVINGGEFINVQNNINTGPNGMLLLQSKDGG
jgi:hypothetical protein